MPGQEGQGVQEEMQEYLLLQQMPNKQAQANKEAQTNKEAQANKEAKANKASRTQTYSKTPSINPETIKTWTSSNSSSRHFHRASRWEPCEAGYGANHHKRVKYVMQSA